MYNSSAMRIVILHFRKQAVSQNVLLTHNIRSWGGRSFFLKREAGRAIEKAVCELFCKVVLSCALCFACVKILSL